MNAQGGDRLESLLFDEEGELANIKLFPGDDRELTAHDLRETAADVIAAALADPKNNPPDTGRAKTTLENFSPPR